MKYIFLFVILAMITWINSLLSISMATIVKETNSYNSPIRQCLWLPNLADGKLPWLARTHKVIQPFDHVVLQDHMTNQNYYMSTT